MAVTAEMLARLRRMCSLDASDGTYTNAVLTEMIERYPIGDEWGELPYYEDASTTPPSRLANENWVPTFDLASAASDYWQERAAALAEHYDVSADGSSRSLSQQYENAMRQARMWRAQRVAASIRIWTIPRDEQEAALEDRFQ